MEGFSSLFEKLVHSRCSWTNELFFRFQFLFSPCMGPHSPRDLETTSIWWTLKIMYRISTFLLSSCRKAYRRSYWASRWWDFRFLGVWQFFPLTSNSTYQWSSGAHRSPGIWNWWKISRFWPSWGLGTNVLWSDGLSMLRNYSNFQMIRVWNGLSFASTDALDGDHKLKHLNWRWEYIRDGVRFLKS